MVSSKEESVEFLRRLSGESSHNVPKAKEGLSRAIEVLHEFALKDGLSKSDLDIIIQFLISNKLGGPVQISLLSCLIPETDISKNGLEEIVAWLFSGVESHNIAHNVQKKCMQWLLGVTYYELADLTALDLFYCSFLFLMNQPHLEQLVCDLLCLISKPEDANRWAVQQIFKIQSISGPKKHTNAFLNLLKSFRPDVVPEKIPSSTFCYVSSCFDGELKKAHQRKLENASLVNCLGDKKGLQLNSWKLFDVRSKNLARLIPVAENLNLEEGLKSKGSRCSIAEILSKRCLDSRPSQLECPAQSLSLLSNTVGYRLLAFSNINTKTRFSHKLHHTLWRVFVLDLEPYSETEKINFLNSLLKFHEYIQQSIPAVTGFLFSYLLVWDGETYQDQIFKLVEWIQVRDEKDLEDYIFTPFRQIFISSETYCKCLIIRTMANFMRNQLVMDKKEITFFTSEYLELNVVKVIEAVGRFVDGLVSTGLIWNNETQTRNILSSAIDFYEVAQAVEQAGDLPIMILLPPVLVYKCLFSGSVMLVARICSLLVTLLKVSVERLRALGVFEDFSKEVQILKIYIMDVYRCLWGTVEFSKDFDSFLFNENSFLAKFSKLKDIYGPLVHKLCTAEQFSVFWNPNSKGTPEIVFKELAQDFPSIVTFKGIVENEIIQDNGMATE